MLRFSLIAAASQSVYGFAAVGRAPTVQMSRTMSSPVMSGFGDFSATTLGGDTVSMESLKGKPTLILNVASL